MVQAINHSHFDAFFAPCEAGKSALIDSLKKETRQCEELAQLVNQVASRGFVFIGDTSHGASKSSAQTDFQRKEISVDLSRSCSQVILSLAYELINASNAEGFREIQNQYLTETPTLENSEKYAGFILKKEVEALFFRTRIAAQLNMDPKKVGLDPFYQKVYNSGDSIESKRSQMFQRMKESGTVHLNRFNAFKFYQAQYFEYNIHSSAQTKRLAHLLRQEAAV